jgi:CopG family transcriptional regulator/antitoxin EndoAI
MSKRINITLPDTTLTVLDRIAPKGNRSRVISDAVLQYAKQHSRRSLRERLKQGYIANAELSRQIAEEWFPLEEEAWEIFERSHNRKEVSPVAEKSTLLSSTRPAVTKSRKRARL